MFYYYHVTHNIIVQVYISWVFVKSQYFGPDSLNSILSRIQAFANSGSGSWPTFLWTKMWTSKPLKGRLIPHKPPSIQRDRLTIKACLIRIRINNADSDPLTQLNPGPKHFLQQIFFPILIYSTLVLYIILIKLLLLQILALIILISYSFSSCLYFKYSFCCT